MSDTESEGARPREQPEEDNQLAAARDSLEDVRHQEPHMGLEPRCSLRMWRNNKNQRTIRNYKSFLTLHIVNFAYSKFCTIDRNSTNAYSNLCQA